MSKTFDKEFIVAENKAKIRQIESNIYGKSFFKEILIVMIFFPLAALFYYVIVELFGELYKYSEFWVGKSQNHIEKRNFEIGKEYTFYSICLLLAIVSINNRPILWIKLNKQKEKISKNISDEH